MFSFPRSALLFSLCPLSCKRRESYAESSKGLPSATELLVQWAEPSVVPLVG
jgi:hypothetical protein